MFFIVNKTKNELQISDIKISLGPRQAMDLDKIIDRSKSDRSRDLDLAIKQGVIQVKQKTPTETPIIISNNNDDDLETSKIDDMKEYLAEEIKNQFDILKSGLTNSKNNNDNSGDLSQILNQLKGLVNNNSTNESVDEDVIMDEEKLSNIHARSIDKKLKNVESNEVKYDKKEIEDNIEDNISELEGLL